MTDTKTRTRKTDLTNPDAALSVSQAAAILGKGATGMRAIPKTILPHWTVGTRGDRRYRVADVLSLRDRMIAGDVAL